MHEASLHRFSSFVTLTYDSSNLKASLDYSDFQKFMKRLRGASSWFPSLSSAWNDALIVAEADAFARSASLPGEADARRRERLRERRSVRFAACGEYGENFHRPHFHALLFGKNFPDRKYWRKSSAGFPLYRSRELERLWPFGHSEIGDVSFESAAYVARYNVKDSTTVAVDGKHYFVCRYTGEVTLGADGSPLAVAPEEFHMSLKPAIGLNWIRAFRTDVYRGDGDAYCVVNGMKVKPPRYYDQYMSETLELDEVKAYRAEKAFARRDDQTPERLAVQEHVTRARLKFKKRTLE